MVRIGWVFLLGFGLSAASWAQTDSLATADLARDTTEQEEKQGFFKKNYPDPMKAGLMSLVIPGSGQIYNKSWWKVPLVYGALGGMGYLIRYNNEQYRRLEDAYQASLRDEEHEFTGTAIDDPRSLRNIRDSFDKNRQLSWVGFIVVYVLNGVEAFVDAHLQNFDIDEELSLRVRPTFDLVPGPSPTQPVVGIGISIPLGGTGRGSGQGPASPLAR